MSRRGGRDSSARLTAPSLHEGVPQWQSTPPSSRARPSGGQVGCPPESKGLLRGPDSVRQPWTDAAAPLRVGEAPEETASDGLFAWWEASDEAASSFSAPVRGERVGD